MRWSLLCQTVTQRASQTVPATSHLTTIIRCAIIVARVVGVKRESELRRFVFSLSKSAARACFRPSPPPLPPTPPVSRHSRPSYPAPHATPTLSSPNLFTLTKISIYNRCRRLAERMRVNWRSTITRRVSAGNWRLFMLTGSGRAC